MELHTCHLVITSPVGLSLLRLLDMNLSEALALVLSAGEDDLPVLVHLVDLFVIMDGVELDLHG